MEKQHQKQPHIAIVPSPGLGHLIPFAEFAKLLVTRFDVSVTLLLPTRANDHPIAAQTTLLTSLPDGVSYVYLPPVDLSHLPDDASHDVIWSLILLNSVSSVRAKLDSIINSANVVALVTDLFGTSLFDVAKELGIPRYMYFTTNAMYLLFLRHLPSLNRTMSCEFHEMSNPIMLPGCVPLHGDDIEDALQDRKSEAYEWNLHHVKRYVSLEGIFVNTFSDLESMALQGLKSEDPNWPPVHPIGPIFRSRFDGEDDDGSECLRWLDQQLPKSVLFVSFGSGGTLSNEQLNELAIGLEKSGHKFLWVVRSPNDESSCGTVFSTRCQNDPFSFLPKEFLDRTKDRRFLVPSWAPQVKVLSHGSTAGFLTHCGWNSILESIVHGVPMIAWPLYAEQKTNAAILTEGYKVALRPKYNRQGLIEAEQVEKVVQDLMDGEEGKIIRNRVEELSVQAQKAIHENGDSTRSLDEVALKWMLSKRQLL